MSVGVLSLMAPVRSAMLFHFSTALIRQQTQMAFVRQKRNAYRVLSQAVIITVIGELPVPKSFKRFSWMDFSRQSPKWKPPSMAQ
jgi:hypothetical protein